MHEKTIGIIGTGKIATVLILLITAATLIGACINIHNNYNAYQETVDDINGYWIDEIH